MSAIAQATPSETTQNQCSRCDGPLDTTGYPLWCKSCQNKYRKELNGLKKQMQETRGYAAGVTATKDYFARRFAALATGTFSGFEVAALIRQSQFPNVD